MWKIAAIFASLDWHADCPQITTIMDSLAMFWQYNQRTIQFLGAVGKVLTRFKNYNTIEPGTNVTSSDPSAVRVLSLTNNSEALVYIHNYTNHSTQTNGASVGVTFAGSGSTPYSGVWLSATTGDSVGAVSGQMASDAATISIPSFTSDLLLYIVLNPSTSVTKQEHTPREFALSQNYPNPFNPSTTIQFILPRSEFVILRVFNVLGEEIATLAAETFSAGTHKVEWNPQGLPSGVYFYRIQADTFMDSKKLLLLR